MGQFWQLQFGHNPLILIIMCTEFTAYFEISYIANIVLNANYLRTGGGIFPSKQSVLAHSCNIRHQLWTMGYNLLNWLYKYLVFRSNSFYVLYLLWSTIFVIATCEFFLNQPFLCESNFVTPFNFAHSDFEIGFLTFCRNQGNCLIQICKPSVKFVLIKFYF